VGERERIPELDGLRGIAIGLVLIWHYFFLLIRLRPGTILSYAFVSLRLTWTGVDLFFVLSGFLIGGILLDARDSSNYFAVFYSRRFFRIVPIYLLCLGGVFVLSALIKAGMASKVIWMMDDQLPWTPYLLFIQNFWMAQKNTLGSFGLGATWSLSVEEQFYLSLPTLVRFLTTRRLVTILICGILTAPVLRAILRTLWPDHFISWFVLMPCRADALLLGALAAVGLRESSFRAWLVRNQRLLQLFILVFLGGMGFLTLRAPDPRVFLMLSVGFTWQALFYLAVLLYAILFPQSILSRCLRWGWLAWLGSIAYGTYLLHEFVLGGIHGLIWSRPPIITNVWELAATLMALLLTLMICHLSWQYFERPLVRVGHSWHYLFDSPDSSQLAAPGVEGRGAATP